MAEVDLQRLASGYDHRPMSPAARVRALDAAEGLSGVLLDIGGGRGGHAACWARDDRTPVVVDPSTAMLTHAAEHRGVAAIRASAQELPFATGSVALSYAHLSIHFGEWTRAVDEFLRVTRPGGRIVIWTMTHSALRASSLAKWFPRVREIDQMRFPSPRSIAEALDSVAGDIAVVESVEHMERSAGEWMSAVRGGFVSTLHLLDANEIREGLIRFRETYPDLESRYRTTLRLTRIQARR